MKLFINEIKISTALFSDMLVVETHERTCLQIDYEYENVYIKLNPKEDEFMFALYGKKEVEDLEHKVCGQFVDEKFSILEWCLLHEVGHYLHILEVGIDEFSEMNAKRKEREIEISKMNIPQIEKYALYREIEIEKIADKNAIAIAQLIARSRKED